MQPLDNLFQPIKLGRLEIKNRIAMLPMTTGYNEMDATIGDRLVNYFAARAKGGVGLISVPVTPTYIASPMQPGLYDDRFIPGARRLTQEVHACGTSIAAQLLTQYHLVTTEGHAPEVVAPSPIFNKMMGCEPRALTVEEINWLVEQYGKAARRAQEAGFDAVEIPIIGGYLLNRFLSPHSNKRTDEYGGSLENRIKIIVEIIERIKQAAGEQYPVVCRLNIQENIQDGHTIEDSERVACLLEAADIVAISVYTGWHESPVPTIQCSVPRAAFVHLAERIKEVVRIPVICANRINDPIVANRILSEGKSDIIGMGRALIADPELPNKAREGRIDEIVPCIACSRCLAEVMEGYRSWGKSVFVSCTVNPSVGREAEYAIEPAERARKVLVVGGGPGGMEAATVAALRGHRVTLYERANQLGGKLLVASLPPHKDEISALVNNLVARTLKAGVEVRLDAEVDPKTIGDEKPEVVVLATGATPAIPDIPGTGLGNVVTAEDILTGRKQAGNTVIVIGGGMVGCETAEFLAKQGKQVIVLEALGRMAADIAVTYRPFFLARLNKMGIRMETNAEVEEITNEGTRINQNGTPAFIGADTVALAVGYKSNKQLGAKLRGKVAELYLVGDCVEPRTIREAIKEGFGVGRQI